VTVWVKEAKRSSRYSKIILPAGSDGYDIKAKFMPHLNPSELSSYCLYFIDNIATPSVEEELVATASDPVGEAHFIGAPHDHKYFLVAAVGKTGARRCFVIS
jgi:hypothetical protein